MTLSEMRHDEVIVNELTVCIQALNNQTLACSSKASPSSVFISSSAARPRASTGTVNTGAGCALLRNERSGCAYTSSVMRSCTCAARPHEACVRCGLLAWIMEAARVRRCGLCLQHPSVAEASNRGLLHTSRPSH